ncbi:MAG: right-handed parallel beta-helix repeat-containing protein [Chloroflexota bacterium]
MRSWVRPGAVVLALLVAALVVPGGPARSDRAAAGGGTHAARLAEIEAPYRLRTRGAQTIWVDPVRGDDDAPGATRATALRTLAAAWARVPAGTRLTRGIRILITPGTLGEDAVPHYMEDRRGTADAPIVIAAADGPGTVTLPTLNVYGTDHLALVGVRIRATGGDGFHCEQCDHLLLRRVTVRGADPESWRIGDLVKINQSSSIFIERSVLSGASDNTLDLVAVQYASIRRNRISDAMDWCAYAKGGSAYIRVDGNRIFDCGVGGFTAGQGTGFQFMVPPWIHYEAYDVRIVNNVIHDVWGAGVGVNGGYAVLIAHNTLADVGSRSHLLELVAGGRSCDGSPGDPGRGRCATYRDQGGWGTSRVDDGTNHVRIPNRHVYVVRNLIVNRAGRPVGDQVLAVAAPFSGAAQDGSGVPVPTRFDTDLRFAGNVIVTGTDGLPLGIGDETGCAGGGSTCSAAKIRADNAIDTRAARLRDAAGGDFRLVDRAVAILALPELPAFAWDDLPAAIPAGRRDLAVPYDRVGAPRGTEAPAGAWA